MSRLQKVLRLFKSQQARSQPACRFRGAESARKSTKRLLVDVERPQDLSIQFAFFPKLNPVVASSLFLIWYAIGRLRSHVDFRFGIPVIFAFLLANQHGALSVPNFERVLDGRVKKREFVDPGMLGRKIDSFAKQAFVPVQYGYRGSRKGMIRVESRNQIIVMASKTKHSGQSGARYTADFPHRHPVLREMNRLPRLHEGIGFLI